MSSRAGQVDGFPINLPKLRSKGSNFEAKGTQCIQEYFLSMKVRDTLKAIEAGGWYLVRCKGSHRQYKHPRKLGRVTIAGHVGDDLAPGTLNSILKQAELKAKN